MDTRRLCVYAIKIIALENTYKNRRTFKFKQERILSINECIYVGWLVGRRINHHPSVSLHFHGAITLN
jgi:hypothetical protein